MRNPRRPKVDSNRRSFLYNRIPFMSNGDQRDLTPSDTPGGGRATLSIISASKKPLRDASAKRTQP
eukprot:scaffold189944_cov28-Tisochrysis_lutea.AAC.1